MARRPSPAADRRALIARGYDPAKLARFERDSAASVFSDIVRELLTVGADRATPEQLGEQIAANADRLRLAPPGRVAAFLAQVGDLLRAALVRKMTPTPVELPERGGCCADCETAPKTCEHHTGVAFEDCDCPPCEWCCGKGCQSCGWTGRFLCPYCGQPRVGVRDECGSIGAGICEGYAKAVDADEICETGFPSESPQAESTLAARRQR